MALAQGLAMAVLGLAPVAGQTGPVAEPTNVVATTTVLADLVAQTGGPLVNVTSLVPKGGEVHTFDPSPDDAVALADADLIVMNGLGLDAWLHDLIQAASATEVPVVELATDLEGVTYLASEEEHAEEPEPSGEVGHEGEAANPHLWLNVGYAELYVDRIIESLSAVDPAHATEYAASGAAYRDRLVALDGEIRDRMAAIPEDRRKVVSFHEAFPYFAAAYGLEIVGTVLHNPGDEPSAADMAALIDEIRSQGVSAILAETQFPDDLVDTISQETGVSVVRGLYNDTLGDPPVDTYEGMMRSNVELIEEALR
jgi:ABC-type Zn uptake system ZnuABC Zn-binding protein ZnuA